MTTLFCCSNIQPYRPRVIVHEPKFSAFLRWATFPKESTVQSSEEQAIKLSNMDHPHVIQLVKQINFGALESVRYFAATGGKGEEEAFHEVEEADLIAANYQKVNTYKNFKCPAHNKFFEVNIYEKDPVNKHHWRHNIARPSSEIDL